MLKEYKLQLEVKIWKLHILKLTMDRWNGEENTGEDNTSVSTGEACAIYKPCLALQILLFFNFNSFIPNSTNPIKMCK